MITIAEEEPCYSHGKRRYLTTHSKLIELFIEIKSRNCLFRLTTGLFSATCLLSKNYTEVDGELSISRPYASAEKKRFFDLDLRTHDLWNLMSSWPDCRKYLCKFWFQSLRWSGADELTRSSSQDFEMYIKVKKLTHAQTNRCMWTTRLLNCHWCLYRQCGNEAKCSRLKPKPGAGGQGWGQTEYNIKLDTTSITLITLTTKYAFGLKVNLCTK